ncbi:hypothetical protein IAI10_17375 [Clostridium sp. 19966]|uniref:hypothetical protein n=1 Tax=Clostridium sp. 19966 TaxID=2768166 RepID=UPI0028DF4030|nr:hypothetical protein [Clostridium sp. 19966]MDT8718440.1 hypothetical protein [Clostridium sp. 19966]
MRNKKLNFYFFGDIGEYDNYNPEYVCNKEHASEMLYLIAKNDPFSISKFKIAEILNIKEEIVENIINNLELINAIETKENTYRVKFPVFLEEDVIVMEHFVNGIGEVIGKRIVDMKDALYAKASKLRCSKSHSYERILYHTICDKIFDGTAFEFFTERDIFCASKLQPGNRDYIIVAYENSKLTEKHSNKILCSSNNYSSFGFTFNSFGDSNGLRKDMFRFFRLTQKNIDSASPFHKVNIVYNKILDKMNKEIAYECGTLIHNAIDNNIQYSKLSEEEKSRVELLKELEYISINGDDNIISVDVPIFYDFELSTIIKELSDVILENILPIVKEVFDSFEVNASILTPVRHKVNIKETANEVWHQIFGAINEYLVKEGFVATPNNIDGQGRYLRSLTIPEIEHLI